jgi:uncharacterized membrane protein YphA (DoxX/SURF4 family)
MSKSWLTLARILYSIPLVITGIIYLWKPQDAVESLTSFLPGGLSLMYVAGALWLIFGSMIALHIKPKWGAWGVISSLLAYQIMVHIPAVYTGEYLVVVWFELLRDLSLMGGAIFILVSLDFVEEPVEERFVADDWEITIH